MKALSPEQVQKMLAKPSAAKKQPESYILGAVRDWARAHGWFVFRMQQGLGCHKGIADLCAVKGGRTVWLEIKTPTGKQSDYQIVFQAQIEEHGGEYAVCRCVEDAQEALS